MFCSYLTDGIITVQFLTQTINSGISHTWKSYWDRWKAKRRAQQGGDTVKKQTKIETSYENTIEKTQKETEVDRSIMWRDTHLCLKLHSSYTSETGCT